MLRVCNDKDMIWAQDSGELIDGYTYFCSLSEAIDDDNLSGFIVEMDNDGYKNYNDDMYLKYSRLSLFSLMELSGIEPMEVLIGNKQYYIFIKMDKIYKEKLLERLAKAESGLVESLGENFRMENKLNDVAKKLKEYVTSKDVNTVVKLKKELYSILNITKTRNNGTKNNKDERFRINLRG